MADPGSSEPRLLGYSEIMGFGHDSERIRELEPQVVDFMHDVSRLWEVDVTGFEMAIDFRARKHEW
jgi:hypothetical protein